MNLQMLKKQNRRNYLSDIKIVIKKYKATSTLIMTLAIIFACIIPGQALSFAEQVGILDVSNEKLSYASYTKSNVLVIGEGADRKFFKEKQILISPENVIETETKLTFGDQTFMREEIRKILDKRLDFDTALSKIKSLQPFANCDLNEFEKICRKKYMSSEFGEKYCDTPLDRTQDLSIRNVATTQMAELLDVADLIANAVSVRLKNKDGELLEGILMDLAEGIEFADLDHQKTKIAPSMQKASTSLQIFDSICGQCDRFYKNYNIIVSSDGNAIWLCAFDNDWSFTLDTDMKKCRAWLPPVIDKNGKIKLPHIDKKLAESILKINDEIIEDALKELLDKEYIAATQNRVKQIQDAIKFTISSNEKFLLEDDEWGEKTINEEINGEYHEPYSVKTKIGVAVFGRTYLKLLHDSLRQKQNEGILK